MFQYKGDKKLRATEVKLTAFQKHETELWSSKATNLETNKTEEVIEIHQSQITNLDLRFFRVRQDVMARKRRFFRLWLTSQKNPKSKDAFDIADRVLSETDVSEKEALTMG